MTDKKPRKRRKLAHEIVGLLGVSVVISLVLFQILYVCAAAIVESFYAARDITLTDIQLAVLDDWVFNLGLLVTVFFFIIFFLFLLGERLSYIRDIIKGIDALRSGQQDHVVLLEGRNELTQLAEAVNYLADAQRQVREKERALNDEKEQFIRTLSHDIRTPLTSIMAYSEILTGQESCSERERREYLELIRKKADQIKELTDILLDGGVRNPERFENARLLIEQLADEFEESLEAEYRVSADLTGCPDFAGTFDVREMRRIFDNLISNIRKYADAEKPVTLHISVEEQGIVIRQENARRTPGTQTESYRMGINSIRRIAHNYAGQVEIRQEDDIFGITVTLSDI